MNRMTYTFEEIDVTINGETFCASGDIDVSYEIFERDTTVGMIRPDVQIDGFAGATLDLVNDNGDITTIYAGVNSNIWNQIVAGIDQDHVIEEISIYDGIS